MQRFIRVVAVPVLVGVATLISGAASPKPRNVDWTNIHAKFYLSNQVTEVTDTLDLWWAGRNEWRLENQATGRISIADGTFMYEEFPDKKMEAGGPLDPSLTYAPSPFLSEPHIERILDQAMKGETASISGRKATSYELVEGSSSTLYWIDDEFLFPLRISATEDEKPVIDMEVFVIEKEAPVEKTLFAIPVDNPAEPFVHSKGQAD